MYDQIFFVAQDKRDSSKTTTSRFNKQDFIEMLYGIKQLGASSLPDAQIGALKEQQKILRTRKQELLKQAKAIQQVGTAISFISPTADRNEQEKLFKKLNDLKNAISDLRKQRTHDQTRKAKNEEVLDELRSLNQKISVGSVICLNCGSGNIGYKPPKSDYVFDITTKSVRRQIINSVEERINYYGDRINSINLELRKAQAELRDLLADKQVTLADIVSSQTDYISEREIDLEIDKINTSLENIEQELETKRRVSKQTKEERKEFMDQILSDMNYAQKRINEEYSDDYPSLFTSQKSFYSGSELTEFLSARVYALAKELHHDLPILIDSFREAELSTSRENNLLDLLNELPNQIILTATVKEEEGTVKYSQDSRLHAIDYSGHVKNKILTSRDNRAFKEEIKKFGIIFSEDSEITSSN